MQATRVTLTVALPTVAIATPLGVAAAYAVSQSTLRIMRLVHGALLLPLVVPIIITAVGIFFVYAKIGLIATMTGLVLANVMLGLPYVVISVVAGLQSFDMTQEMVARSLGMNRLRSFLRRDAAADQLERDRGRDLRLHLGDGRDHRRDLHFRRAISAAHQADVHGAARRNRSDDCSDLDIDDGDVIHAGPGCDNAEEEERLTLTTVNRPPVRLILRAAR